MEITKVDLSVFAQQTQDQLNETAANASSNEVMYTQADANCMFTLVNC